MTQITLYRDKDGNIVKGHVSGHSGFGDEGNDIVCASVSSVLYMALNGIENVLNTQFGYETRDGYVEFILPCDLNDDKIKEINILLDSMYLFLQELQSQYPDNVKITELEV